VSIGRVCGVPWNPNHEAVNLSVRGDAVEAYRSCLPSSGAAGGTQDAEFDFLLPFRHPIWCEPTFLHPFDAAFKACSLRWEVLQDLSHAGASFLDPKPFAAVPNHELPSCISQEPHSKHVGYCVRFEDCIDVHLGAEDSDCLHGFRMKHDWLQGWADKPWSGQRIACLPRSPPAAFSNEEISTGFYIPQIISKFSLLDSWNSNGWDNDDFSFMQLSFANPVTCKQDDFQPGEAALQASLQHGTADSAMHALQDEGSSTSSGQAESFDIPVDVPQSLAPSSVSSYRQDVIIYHLHDDPIRAFLDWSSYESMVIELAHHFGLHRQGIIDAYEIVTPLRDLPPDVTPIIAHLLNDIPVGHAARLVLFDLELHGHRIESHFRLGPSTERFVLPVPERTDRNGILVLADVDKYCKAEGGRCLVFHNAVRWPDYDTRARQFVHGDTIRIALPPSDRFECPTDRLVTWTQQDLTDVEIMNHMDHGAPAEGYSPGLLADEDARALATPNLLQEGVEGFADDIFHAMQRQLTVPSASSERSEHSDESSEIPPDWFIDLQRVVDHHVRNCAADPQDETVFSVYTWLLNHESSRLCTAPKIAILGGDPTEWFDDITYPWRFHIDPNQRVFLDLVLPHSPRADVEEHIAHVLITQKPTVYSSALLSLDFQDPIARSVILRFAIAVPRVCTFENIAEIVPYFASIDANRLIWVNPASFSPEYTFKVHNGMGILAEVRPVVSPEASHASIEDVAPLQASIAPVVGPQVSLKSAEQPVPSCSIMEELLEAVNAANNAIDNQPLLPDPASLEAQSEGIRDLWERLTDQLAMRDLVPGSTHRIESWFLDHRGGHNRCHSSRIVLVNEDFLTWKASFAATWQDRLAEGEEFSLAIVYPESEDRAAGVFAQVIVTLHPMFELRSTLISVYDSDPDRERNPHTFAAVLPYRFDLDELLHLLHLHADCPSTTPHNRCTLWFGTVPLVLNRQVEAHHGHAFRLVISRGRRIESSELLAMDSMTLQQTILDAFICDVFTRPPDPSFMQGSTRNFEGAPSNVLQADARPTWITELHHRFTQVFTVEAPDYSPFALSQVWYVNGRDMHICPIAREVRVVDDPTSWRTDFVFAWRDHLIRAAAAEFVTVQGLPLHPTTQTTHPHVIMSQGLSADQHPVLVTVQCVRHDACPNRQFAFVFLTRTAANDVARVSMPIEFQHLPFVVLLRGMTYLPGETINIQSGNHLQVLVATQGVDPFTEQVVDGFSMLQLTIFHEYKSPLQPTTTPSIACKPAPFEEDDDLPMTFVGPGRNRPPQPAHDGRIEWMNDLVMAVRAYGIYDPWHGFTTLQVTTWLIDHLHFPVCRQSRNVRVTGEIITWIDDFRVAWVDQLDPSATFSIHLVRPTPPSPFHQAPSLHFILEQNRPAHYAAILITARFEGFSDEGSLQGAFSTPDRLDLQRLIDITGIGPHCHGRLCRALFNHQLLPAGVDFDVSTGRSIQVKIEPLEDDVQLPLPPTVQALNDEVELMQRHTGLHWRPRRQSLHVSEAASMPLNPLAPAFSPGSCSIFDQTDFVQDLQPLWQASAMSGEGEAPSVNVITWFLDHALMFPCCRDPRLVTLYDDFTSWEYVIRTRWADRLHTGSIVEFHVVAPTPPAIEPGVAAHIIVVAAPRIEWVSVLVSIVAPHSGRQPERVAITTHEHLTFDRVLQSTGVGQSGLAAICQLWYDHQQILPPRPYPSSSGDGLVLQVPHSLRQTENDDTSWLQTHVLPTFPSRTREVPTWFLHCSAFPVCFKPRFVSLDVQSPLPEMLRGVWFDFADESAIEIVAVTHKGTGELHFIGVQCPRSLRPKVALLEASEEDSPSELHEIRAAFLPDPLSATDIGNVFGVDFNLASGPQLRCCTFHIDGKHCDFSVPSTFQDGAFCQMRWNRRSVSKLPLRIDFGAVIRVFEELDSHFILPTYDLPYEFPWHPHSWDWIQAPWWTPGMICQELVLYYDGSCIKSATDQTAGCAVAAFAKVSGTWCFAGAISSQLGCTTSYVAELAAAILAHKFTFDLLKIACNSQCDPPWVEFRYDSLTVGSHAEGSWQICSQPRMGQFLRSLHRCIESRFGIALHHKHIRAHSGEPGNELVDCLAFQAASGVALNDFQPWLQHVTRADFVRSADWMWYLFRRDLCWDQHEVVFPAGPDTTPDASVFPLQLKTVAPPEGDQIGRLDIKLATCNVLSLKPAKDRHQALTQHLHHGPARQETLLAQFHEAGIHLFAWQETRVKQASNQHDSRYWIFRSPASAHGHYGIFIGIQRAVPIGFINREGRREDVFVQAHEISVIASSPRFLILRLEIRYCSVCSLLVTHRILGLMLTPLLNGGSLSLTPSLRNIAIGTLFCLQMPMPVWERNPVHMLVTTKQKSLILRQRGF